MVNPNTNILFLMLYFRLFRRYRKRSRVEEIKVGINDQIFRPDVNPAVIAYLIFDKKLDFDFVPEYH